MVFEIVGFAMMVINHGKLAENKDGYLTFNENLEIAIYDMKLTIADLLTSTWKP